MKRLLLILFLCPLVAFGNESPVDQTSAWLKQRPQEEQNKDRKNDEFLNKLLEKAKRRLIAGLTLAGQQLVQMPLVEKVYRVKTEDLESKSGKVWVIPDTDRKAAIAIVDLDGEGLQIAVAIYGDFEHCKSGGCKSNSRMKVGNEIVNVGDRSIKLGDSIINLGVSAAYLDTLEFLYIPYQDASNFYSVLNKSEKLNVDILFEFTDGIEKKIYKFQPNLHKCFEERKCTGDITNKTHNPTDAYGIDEDKLVKSIIALSNCVNKMESNWIRKLNNVFAGGITSEMNNDDVNKYFKQYSRDVLRDEIYCVSELPDNLKKNFVKNGWLNINLLIKIKAFVMIRSQVRDEDRLLVKILKADMVNK